MKLLFFTQATCGPCRQLKPHAEAAAKHHSIDIEYIDVQSLEGSVRCSMYGVSSTPSLILVQDDYMVLTYVEARTTLSLIKELSGLGAADEGLSTS